MSAFLRQGQGWGGSTLHKTPLKPGCSSPTRRSQEAEEPDTSRCTPSTEPPTAFLGVRACRLRS